MENEVTQCLLMTGEKSGEEHALTFFRELRSKAPHVHFFGVGGKALENEGLELLARMEDFSSWGLTGVVRKLPFYWFIFRKILFEVKKRKCRSAILVDFQDFNLRLAKRLGRNGVNVLYYMAPQCWVWRAARVNVLKSAVHTLFTILPFEKKWFMDRGLMRVKAVPHPLLHRYAGALPQLRIKTLHDYKKETLNILLLPGSRDFEVSNLLPVFLKAMTLLSERKKINLGLVKAASLPDSAFALARTVGLNVQEYDDDHLDEALKWADMAVAASGTVTLACALFGVPTVVTYKMSGLNAFCFRRFISYKGPFSLANIVSGKDVFPELMQEKLTAQAICAHLLTWSEDETQLSRTLDSLSQIPSLLKGEDFSVPDYMAEVIRA
jgi:lipid-A-disaccharide synthase